MAAVVRQPVAVANELVAVSLFWPAFLSVPSARMNVRTSNNRIAAAKGTVHLCDMCGSGYCRKRKPDNFT
jgi:hypothetical protein